MSNGPRDYSGLFNLLANNKADKTGNTLQTIGKILFIIGFAGGGLAQLTSFIQAISGSNKEPTFLFKIGVALFAGGSLLGLFVFLATATHYIGKENGKTSFLSATMYVLGKTFLYVVLPSIILGAIAIIWAIITHQPTFQ